MAVERLRVGDVLPGLMEGDAPIIWIGRRTIDCRRHAAPARVWPVRIAAHAFGRGRLHADLYLSPDHAIHVDGVLIPVKYLIDGDRIAQVPVPTVTYFHVELPCHDVVLANGLAAETYLDCGDRDGFEGRASPRRHASHAALRRDADGCAPLAIVGPHVERARASIARHAVIR